MLHSCFKVKIETIRLTLPPFPATAPTNLPTTAFILYLLPLVSEVGTFHSFKTISSTSAMSQLDWLIDIQIADKTFLGVSVKVRRD